MWNNFLEKTAFLRPFLGAISDIFSVLHAKFFPRFLKNETGATTIEYIAIAVAAIIFINWFDVFWQAAILSAAATLSFF